MPQLKELLVFYKLNPLFQISSVKTRSKLSFQGAADLFSDSFCAQPLILEEPGQSHRVQRWLSDSR